MVHEKIDYYLNRKGESLKLMAFFGKLNRDYVAYLRNAVNLLLPK